MAICVMVGPLAGEPRVEFREFGTIVAELEQLRQRLQSEGITHVVNVLEDSVKVYLANSQEVKNRKGHKTDRTVGGWRICCDTP